MKTSIHLLQLYAQQGDADHITYFQNHNTQIC